MLLPLVLISAIVIGDASSLPRLEQLERPTQVAESINKFVLAQADPPRAASAETNTKNDFDVVVIGGTPGGIAAAVTAARFGHTVALVEYHRHLGAMSSSGLGSSDIRKPHVIQGFFREFVDRILAHYVSQYGANSENVKLSQNGYRYEASVAERSFDGFVQEQPSVTVLKFHRLESTATDNNRLIAVTIRNRETKALRTLKGKVFIDATYEGDVYAAAGAEFRVGRESRQEFGEPHAGHIYCDVKTKQIVGAQVKVTIAFRHIPIE